MAQDKSAQASGFQLPANPQNKIAKQFNADWYQKHMPSEIAQGQATQLGISTDQLYKLYGAYNQAFPGQRADWSQVITGQSGQPGPQGPSFGHTWDMGTGPAYNWMQQQVANQLGGNIINPAQPQQQAAAQQQQGPQLTPQPTPTVQITPLTPTPQSQAATTTMNVPQANAAATTPLFNLGNVGLGQGQQQPQLPQAQNPLLQPQLPPQGAEPQNPLIQKFQYGGFVMPPPNDPRQQPIQHFQGGGQADWIDQPGTIGGATGGAKEGPMFQRQPGGPLLYSPAADPRWQQYGLGNITRQQVQALGYDPGEGSAANAPTQFAAQYQPSLLGAAALGMPAVINLPPTSQMSNTKGGVQTQPGGTVVGNAVPQTPQGPWLTNPSVFAKAAYPTLSGPGAGWAGGQAGPLTAATPANAAQMPQMPITPAYGANAAAAQPMPGLPPGANPAAAQGPPTDRVPAVLTPGEFVMNRGATQMFGPQLAQMNQMAGPPPAAPAMGLAGMPTFRPGAGLPPALHAEGWPGLGRPSINPALPAINYTAGVPGVTALAMGPPSAPGGGTPGMITDLAHISRAPANTYFAHPAHGAAVNQPPIGAQKT